MGLASSEDSQCPPSSSSSSSTSCTAGSEKATVFYGVCFPKNAPAKPGSGVFTDKDEALQVVKNTRGARFKVFSTFEEAQGFAQQPSERASVSGTSENWKEGFNDTGNAVPSFAEREKGTSFRGPKAQDLVKLRKAIETGDAEYFTHTVWANPRYLIGSGDTPTILQEGSRYNALHIAAKFRQPNMCRLILVTIEDPKFMQMLYNDDGVDTRNQRIAFLVDLYLNMPDKGFCETPLHFAAKFGCLKVVQMLASHPSCDKRVRNKYDQGVRDIVCSRCSASGSDLKRQIENALEDHYYVPVWGAEDGTCQPHVGQPWSPQRDQKGVKPSSVLPLEDGSLLGPSLVVRAYAGPMSPKEAKEFHARWKMPSSVKSSSPSACSNAKLIRGIRLSDTDKGLERIGRQLAKERDVPWMEHWPFLRAYCDLSAPEGLSLLETYLRNKYNELTSEAKSGQLQDISWHRDILGLDDSRSSSGEHQDSLNGTRSSSSGSGVSNICKSFRKLRYHSSPNSDGLLSPKVTMHQQRRSISTTSLLTTSKAWDAGHEATQARGGILHSSPPSPLPSPQHRSKQIVDHICRDIASRISSELHERIRWEQQGTIWAMNGLRLDFIDRIRPGIECLLRVVQHSVDSQELVIDVHAIHASIARYVEADTSEESVCDDFTAFQDLVSRSSHFEMALGDSSTSESDASFDDVARWRGLPSKGCSVAKMLVQQHVRCILNSVVGLMRNKEAHNIDNCTCEWKTETQFPAEGASSHQSPFLQGSGFRSVDKSQGNRVTQGAPPVILPLAAAAVSIPRKGDAKSLSSDFSNAEALKNESSFRTSVASSGYGPENELSDDSLDSLFCTPPSSFQSSHSSSISEVYTPDEGIAVFINGAQPTKLDLDVARALEAMQVDPTMFPHVHRWKHLIGTFTKEETERWQTPVSLRSRKGYSAESQNLVFSSPFPCSPVWHSGGSSKSSHSKRASHDNGCERLSIQSNLYETVFRDLLPE